jgi:hypothetical protein
MRKLTVATAVAVVAASLASFVLPWHPASPGMQLGSISPHELTLAAPAMAASPAADAF